MSQEKIVRGVRYAVSLPSERASQRRSLDERLFLRVPGLYRFTGLIADRVMRLPPGSYLRRLLLTRGAARGAAALNRGDLDAYSENFADDVDYRAVAGAPDDHGPIHGKVAMRAYVQDWIDTFDEFRAQPIELIDAGGNQVVAVFRISGRARLSGIETDLTFAVVYAVRHGKMARGREYWTKEQALEAAGLSE